MSASSKANKFFRISCEKIHLYNPSIMFWRIIIIIIPLIRSWNNFSFPRRRRLVNFEKKPREIFFRFNVSWSTRSTSFRPRASMIARTLIPAHSAIPPFFIQGILSIQEKKGQDSCSPLSGGRKMTKDR